MIWAREVLDLADKVEKQISDGKTKEALRDFRDFRNLLHIDSSKPLPVSPNGTSSYKLPPNYLDD